MKLKDSFQDMDIQNSVDQIPPIFESIKDLSNNLAPMNESIKRLTDPLQQFEQKISKLLGQFREAFTYEYEIIQSKFNAYFNKEGMISPYDVDEFLSWLIAKNPDVVLWNLVDEAKRPYNYNLFHEYSVKCLKEDWNLVEELKFWEKNNDDALKAKKETLSDIITHPKNTEITEGIKTQFKNIQGKRLKLLLMALQELNLLPKERIALKFYKLCKSEFDWDIASYQAMNDYKFNDVTDKPELCEMKQYLENLINPK